MLKYIKTEQYSKSNNVSDYMKLVIIIISVMSMKQIKIIKCNQTSDKHTGIVDLLTAVHL